MAQRETKTVFNTQVTVIGRDSKRHGRFGLTSGNFMYWRKYADNDNASGQWTYQELIQVLEADLESQALADKDLKIPPPVSGYDVDLIVTDKKGQLTEEGGCLFARGLDLRQIDDRKLADGSFQFEDYSSASKKPDFHWTMRLSMRTVVWLLDLYVTRILSKQRLRETKNIKAPVSRQELKPYLQKWLNAIA